ncbi:VPS4-associated protein 1 [Gigaspora rosea]|uniref:VPS4-associated protein 1 n=1 Tax=Gigaspora rosea TaxID=44941 RepID=A0A397V7K6_9GLOM|nr:VPS4-associated protein 1 [Gigaspora rosea]CAG8771493.1 16106_t:CDS:2 [Gigaspora rosea]
MTTPILKNLYTHRTATTERPCFVCNQFTKAVLTTDNGLDWFYTCTSHLNDHGFATVVPEPEKPPPIPPKSTKKKEPTKKEKNADKTTKDEKDTKDSTETKDEKDEKNEDEKNKDEKKKDEKSKDKKETNKEQLPPPITSPPKPKQYVLHRDIFYLRESNLNKKRREQKIQSLLEQLPSVPKTSLQ